MWKKKPENRIPNSWTADLWNEVIGREPHNVGLLIEGYKFRSDTNHISREYLGRLFFEPPHPASGMRVSLAFVTELQKWHDGRMEWWHWGSARIPREEVYGTAHPVHFPNVPLMHVNLGTDKQGELQFAELVERAALLKLGPVPVHIWMKALPKSNDTDDPIMVISRFIIEQNVDIRSD
jgi:hypothetical protein